MLVFPYAGLPTIPCMHSRYRIPSPHPVLLPWPRSNFLHLNFIITLFYCIRFTCPLPLTIVIEFFSWSSCSLYSKKTNIPVIDLVNRLERFFLAFLNAILGLLNLFSFYLHYLTVCIAQRTLSKCIFLPPTNHHQFISRLALSRRYQRFFIVSVVSFFSMFLFRTISPNSNFQFPSAA